MSDHLRISSMCNRTGVPVIDQPQLVYILTEVVPGESTSNLRLPLNFALVLDRSGSMAGEKLKTMKEAVKNFISQLSPDDIVSVFTFETKHQVLIDAQPAANKAEFLNQVEKIRDGGGTNMSPAIQEGLRLVSKNLNPVRVSRLILLTDGEATDNEDDSRNLSKELVFRPGQLTGGDFDFDVGTAGSIALVLATCLLPATLSKARVNIRVRGGTDVRWSPPIDYISLVHLPTLARFGGACALELISRGFYPEGGGEVVAEVTPSGRLNGLRLTEQGMMLGIDGVSYAQNLPEHIVSRMKHSAVKKLVSFKNVKIDGDLRRGPSTGAGIVLASRCERSAGGSSSTPP